MTDKQFSTCWREAVACDDADRYVCEMATSSMWGDPEDAEVPAGRTEELWRVWRVARMSIHDMRQAAGMRMVDMQERYDIPRRTLDDWDKGRRYPPEYVRRMLALAMGLV